MNIPHEERDIHGMTAMPAFDPQIPDAIHL